MQHGGTRFADHIGEHVWFGLSGNRGNGEQVAARWAEPSQAATEDLLHPGRDGGSRIRATTRVQAGNLVHEEWISAALLGDPRGQFVGEPVAQFGRDDVGHGSDAEARQGQPLDPGGQGLQEPRGFGADLGRIVPGRRDYEQWQPRRGVGDEP